MRHLPLKSSQGKVPCNQLLWSNRMSVLTSLLGTCLEKAHDKGWTFLTESVLSQLWNWAMQHLKERAELWKENWRPKARGKVAEPLELNYGGQHISFFLMCISLLWSFTHMKAIGMSFTMKNPLQCIFYMLCPYFYLVVCFFSNDLLKFYYKEISLLSNDL